LLQSLVIFDIQHKTIFVVLYLLWRLVRAAERIADAVEDDGPGAGRSAEENSSGDDLWTENDELDATG